MKPWLRDLMEMDLAADVMAAYRDVLAAEGAADVAVRRVRRDFSEQLADADDARLVWVALAAVQLDLGQVSEGVRDKALQAIRWYQSPKRMADEVPFSMATLESLVVLLGGEAVAAVSPKSAKSQSPPGSAGDVFAVSLPNEGGEAVLVVAGPSVKNPSPDLCRMVWLFDLEVDQVTSETVLKCLLAWRNYRQVWPNGLGRGIGCYDAKGPMPRRKTRLLLKGIPLPPEFLDRMNGFGALHKSADLPWVVGHDANDWKSAQWTVDPECGP